jgi:uncharacterized Tic20 family protein
MKTTTTEITSEERLLAGLSHLLGWLVALVILLVEQQKSRFVRLQALQAIIFSVMMTCVYMLLVGCMLTLVFGGVAVGAVTEAAAAGNGTDSGIGIFMAALSMMGFGLALPVFIVVAFCAQIVRIIAAVISFTGKEFRYPLLHRLAERFLG